jgi:hypothetical protein
MAFPGTYNFGYYKGDTYEFLLRPKDANGNEFILDGFTANFYIATSRGDNPTYSVEADAVVNTVNNTITCTILPAIGSTLNAGTYVYDVEINDGPALVYTIVTGNISVTEQVTGAS